MRKWSWSLVLFFAVPLTAAADTTKEEIIKLAKAGIGDEVIMAYTKRNPLPYKLSSDDIIELKKAGVSDTVLNSLLATPEPEKAPVKSEPAEVFPRTATPETRIVEKVYVPSPQTVYYTSPSRVYYSSSTYPSYVYRNYNSSRYSYNNRCGPVYYTPYSRTRYSKYNNNYNNYNNNYNRCYNYSSRSSRSSFGINWSW